ncbi:MAG: hypothetical protein Q9186_007026 [Xanthomendoza sp. 1 TL-2023]
MALHQLIPPTAVIDMVALGSSPHANMLGAENIKHLLPAIAATVSEPSAMKFDAIIYALATAYLAEQSAASPLSARQNPPAPKRSFEAQHQRTVFWTGGEYIFDQTLNGTIFANQMYVEQLTPAKGIKKPHPLVFLPGGGSTGALWLNTPDNRQGWASYFLDQGYQVHLIDYQATGRSQRLPDQKANIVSTALSVAQFFTAPEKYPYLYPQAKLHSQWPGTGQQGDPTFDQFFASQEPVPANNTLEEVYMRKSMCQLLEKIGKSYLIGHSYGGSFLLTTADQCPELVQGLFGVEPAANPFDVGRRPYGVTATPLVYDPAVKAPSDLIQQRVGESTPGNTSCILQAAPAKKLVNISKVPMKFFTAEASIHITYDHCLAAYLWQAGVQLEWTLLADLNIKGNGHFAFLERNNIEIAKRVVEPWLKAQDRRKGT